MTVVPRHISPASGASDLNDVSGSTTCGSCGEVLTCDALNKSRTCWCQGFPPLPAFVPGDSSGANCLCPSCLGLRLEALVQQAVSEGTREALLGFIQSNAIEKEDTGELVEFIDYRIEEGNWVFSGWYHLKRGYCCGSGCRNCPFD